MEYFPIVTSLPVSLCTLFSYLPQVLELFPSAFCLFPQSLGLASEGFLYAWLSFGTRDTPGAIPFLFSSPLSPALFSSVTSSPRSSSFSISPHALSARASRIFPLFFFTFVKSTSVLRHVISQLTLPTTMSLCVGLSLFLRFSFLSRLGVAPEIQSFHNHNHHFPFLEAVV